MSINTNYVKVYVAQVLQYRNRLTVNRFQDVAVLITFSDGALFPNPKNWFTLN